MTSINVNIVPPDAKLITESPAITYSFKLDNFQQQAQYYIQKGQHVLVTAHTSAGKTVVAESAIAWAHQQNRRVFYTSPIKTLSNQKYSEFGQKFGSDRVGLLTGDIKCNPDAQCVVMTTEILRDMLVHGKLMDEKSLPACVIFDEVHYINNPERGHVWEQCLMSLPSQVTLVMLSATISEADQFAAWIGSIRNSTVNLITTTRRPVPLNHYVYFDDRIHLVIDEKGNYHEATYRQYLQYYQNLVKKSVFKPTGLIGQIVTLLHQKKLTPAIFFLFSRNKCQSYANRVTAILLSREEQSIVQSEFDRYLAKYSVSKSILEKMPQVIEMRQLLTRGVGVHHSGLLPVLKEIVEILFSRGLVRLLFATETFAVGVNMPTRTVVFLESRKFTGGHQRMLKPDEYQQMSGRAGRRGLDQFGTVIHVPVGEIADQSEFRMMTTGRSASVQSKFRIDYRYVLGWVAPPPDPDISKQTDSHGLTGGGAPQEDKKTETESLGGCGGLRPPSNSYLHCQNLKQAQAYQVQIERLHTQIMQIESSNKLSDQQIERINNLIRLESKLISPIDTATGLRIRMNREQERKIKAQIEEIVSSLTDLPVPLSQIRTNYTQLRSLKSQLNGIECEQKACLDELNDKYQAIKTELQQIGTGFITDKGLLTTAGVVATRIAAGHNLLMTELLMGGKLDKLDPASIAAILSVFCDDSRVSEDVTEHDYKVPDNVIELIDWLYQLTDEWCVKYPHFEASLENEPINDTYLGVTYRWAGGVSYLSLLPELTALGIYEGNFVRTMLKLSHLCEELVTACQILDKPGLEHQLTELQSKLVRDVVTFDSLYLRH